MWNCLWFVHKVLSRRSEFCAAARATAAPAWRLRVGQLVHDVLLNIPFLTLSHILLWVHLAAIITSIHPRWVWFRRRYAILRCRPRYLRRWQRAIQLLRLIWRLFVFFDAAHIAGDVYPVVVQSIGLILLSVAHSVLDFLEGGVFWLLTTQFLIRIIRVNSRTNQCVRYKII